MLLKFKNIIFISTFIFFSKWLSIIYLNGEIDISNSLLFDLQDHQYFPSIHALANLNFYPTYNNEIESLNTIIYPIFSIIFHSISFKLFNVYGFIITEFFIIIFFFIILSSIFEKIGFTNNLSLILSIIIFLLPIIVNTYFNDTLYINSIDELFNLRVPRPSITNLYLLLFIRLLLSIEKFKDFNFKRLIIFGVLFSLMFNTFYYNFAVSGLFFLFYYLFFFFKLSNKSYVISIKNLSILFISFLFFSIPTFLLIFLGEPDYSARVGLTKIYYFEKKIILLSHFITNLLTLKFIFIFILISSCYLFLKNLKFYELNKINLLYFIFLSSFLSPLIFVLLSPFISEGYHFTNLLVSISFFILFVYIFLIINFYFKNFINRKILLNIFLVILLSFYSFNSFLNIKQNPNFKKKNDFDELVKFLEQKKIKRNMNVLAFDSQLLTKLILNDHNNLYFVLGIFTSMDDDTFENQIIKIFKFLDFNEYQFIDTFQNFKSGWRYINPLVGKTFYHKYQANKLITFSDIDDFTLEESNFIKKTSPLNSMQFIIPNNELDRLKNKYINYNYLKIKTPELIVFNKIDDFFYKYVDLDVQLFCNIDLNQSYSIYLKRSSELKC